MVQWAGTRAFTGTKLFPKAENWRDLVSNCVPTAATILKSVMFLESIIGAAFTVGIRFNL